MALPLAGKENNTDLHLGNQHVSVYAAGFLSIITV